MKWKPQCLRSRWTCRLGGGSQLKAQEGIFLIQLQQILKPEFEDSHCVAWLFFFCFCFFLGGWVRMWDHFQHNHQRSSKTEQSQTHTHANRHEQIQSSRLPFLLCLIFLGSVLEEHFSVVKKVKTLVLRPAQPPPPGPTLPSVDYYCM